MHIYKPLTSPSTVTHCVSCNFTGKSQNLIVIRGESLLQIYSTARVQKQVLDTDGTEQDQAQSDIKIVEGDESFLDTAMRLESAREEYNTKLVLESEFQLEGNVTGLEAIKNTLNSGSDSLLVSFKFAKMTLVSWDFGLNTLSLHYYEKDLTEESFFNRTFESVLRVDPNGACASLSIKQDSIAFLPFVKHDILDDFAILQQKQQQNGGNGLPQLYLPSFILPSKALHESISNIIDFCFLYEYREPTVAIIYEPVRTWAGTIPLHKDTVRYLVLSLDLQQRSSTAIVSAQSLPYDVRKLVPVRDPIGGSLLVGVNELIHIDSQGRQHGVSTNAYSSLVTELQLFDQKDLNITLDGCQITHIPGVEDEMLLITIQGSIFSLKFELESRKVQSIKLKALDNNDLKVATPSAVATVGDRHIFIGSKTSDSKFIQWKRRGEKMADDTEKLAITSSKPKPVESYGDELDDIYGDDDGDSGTKVSSSTSLGGQPIIYSVHDTLKCYGPINDLVVGRARDTKKLNVVAAAGYGSDMSLAIFNQRIYPAKFSDLSLNETYDRIWTLNPSGISSLEEVGFDNFMVASTSTSTDVYSIGNDFTLLTNDIKNFASSEPTFAASSILQGQVIAIVHKSGITLYDANWSKLYYYKLSTLPVSATFAEDYISINFQNNLSTSYQVQNNDNKWKVVVKRQSKGTPVSSFISLSVSEVLSELVAASDKKRSKRTRDDVPIPVENNVSNISFAFAIGDKTEEYKGHFLMYLLQDVAVTYDLSILAQLPEIAYLKDTTFVSNKEERKENAITVDCAKHFFISNETEKGEYLAIKSTNNLFYIYKIHFHDSQLYLTKVHHSTSLSCLLSDDDEKPNNIELVPFKNIDGFSGLFVTGASPLIVLKDEHGPVMVHKIASENPIVGFTPFNTTSVYQGFAYVDDQSLFQIAKLPSDTDFSLAWPAKRVNLNCSITSVCYQDSSDVYMVATLEEVPFRGVDEDGLPLPGALDEMPSATNFQSKVKLLSPLSWTVIDEITLLDNETVLTMQSVSLRVSDKGKRRKDFIVFGTSIMRGEDLAARGSFHVYEVIEVIPEPGKPETSRKLKLVISETGKGAVTSICEVAGDLLIAQEQKVIVRNIQEDNSISPVAFLDMNMYVIQAKGLKYMTLLGDAVRGVWLVGYGVSIL